MTLRVHSSRACAINMFLQGVLALGAGSVGYLRYVGLVTGPRSLVDLASKSGDGALAAKLAGASAALLAVNFAEWSVFGDSGNGPIARSMGFFMTLFGQEKRRKIVVNDWIDEYNRLHKSEDSSERNSAYSKLVNYYYELATLFYEVGWCPSFHFAYRMAGESFAESIRRHEYYLAGFLGLNPGAKVCIRVSLQTFAISWLELTLFFVTVCPNSIQKTGAGCWMRNRRPLPQHRTLHQVGHHWREYTNHPNCFWARRLTSTCRLLSTNTK